VPKPLVLMTGIAFGEQPRWHENRTTGCRSRPLIVEPDPAGFFQNAPGTYSHQLRASSRGTGPEVLRQTNEPGTRRSGSASG
jgi:hypothetical protein